MRNMPRFHLYQTLAIVLSCYLVGSSAWAQEQMRPTLTSVKDEAAMVLVPAGSFTLGMDRREAQALVKRLKKPWLPLYDQEFLRRTMTLGAFYIDRYEVTNTQYQRFVRESGHRPSRYARWPQFNQDQQPVVGVGWHDAEAYCAWAGKRLPTEFEWEKAARATSGTAWPWGNKPDESAFNGRKQGKYGPVKVGSYPSGNSPYGISDMAGNVWEMTSSPWPNESQPTGHVMRGGSFLNGIADVRSTVRWAANDEQKGAEWLGFRCVMDPANVASYAR